MFARVRRLSRAQPAPVPDAARDAPAPPLPPYADPDYFIRPSSAGGIAKKSKSPPIPRIASTKDVAPPLLSAQQDDSELKSLRAQRSYEHFFRPRSALSAVSQSRDSLPLREQDGRSPKTTYVTLDPRNSNTAKVSPLATKSTTTSSTASPAQDSFSDDIVKKLESGLPNGTAHDHHFSPMSGSILDINFDSPNPVMEASVFPSFQPQSLPILPDPPTMNRSFIDSRDRPYANPAQRTPPGQSPTVRTPLGSISAISPTSTIGVPFESTSSSNPLPQHVATRPKTAGSMSKVAGVDVPTHHSKSDTMSIASKTEKRRTKLLNPMALLSRRRSAYEAPMDDEKKAAALAGGRQREIASVGVHTLPNASIRGKIVHDFSAPRRSTLSPSPVEESFSHFMYPGQVPVARPTTRSPVFVEHFADIDRMMPAFAAESRENKEFLARQSVASNLSQESAILPPFARRSQTIEPQWRDDEGSWSSGRDSGGISSTAPDRESGTSFSVVSPITGRSSASNPMPYGFDSQMFALSPISANFERKPDLLDRPISKLSHTSDTPRPRSQSESTARPSESHTDTQEQTEAGAENPGELQRQGSTSRFSFQDAPHEDEVALEKKMPVQSPPPDDDDFEYFDEDAINDLDELELENVIQAEEEPVAYIAQSPKPIDEPKVQSDRSHRKSRAESRKSTAPKRASDEFFYNGHIPYQPNERELTYAEHPVFQTHSALVDESRRTSYQSTLFDSYLASSPTASSPRHDNEERRGSTPSLLGAKNSASPGTRRSSTQATSMSVLYEEPAGENGLKSFDFTDEPQVERSESTHEKPKWSRTADLWKQYSVETPSPKTTPQPFPDRTSVRNSYVRGGPRVRKPSTGIRQARNSVVPRAVSTDMCVSPRSSRMVKDRASARLSARPDSRRVSRIKTAPPPLLPKNSEIGVAQSEPPSEARLQQYHQALADAATKAAAAGRFTRQPSVATVDTAIISPSTPAATVAAADTSPNKMAFDFGFDDSQHDQDNDEDDDDDSAMVAAANADALSHDPAFYGSEFGFYGKAKPGNDEEATDGGWFGEGGDDGLQRQRSLKEPNLTPITERSEFSTRNSLVSLGGTSTPTPVPVPAPVLARMPVDALSEDSYAQLKRLRQNAFGNQGSSSSLTSTNGGARSIGGSEQNNRASPTSPHFGLALTAERGSSIAASDSTGSGDSRHHSAIMEDLSSNAALVQHKSSPLTSH